MNPLEGQPGSSSPAGIAVPREFVQQFEAAHLHRLRQRVFWYCVAVLGLLALAFTRIVVDLSTPVEVREHLAFIALRAISATTLLVCYICVALYILPPDRGREQIIKAYGLLIIVTTLVITLAMPRIDNGRFLPGAEPGEFGAAAVAQQAVTLFFILLLHLIASLLVELSPRDGLRIYVPMLAIYGIGLVIDPYLDRDSRVWLAVVAPILGLPGLLWSWWRHRAFADRFIALSVAERYARVSKEMMEARRVHEALFPPAKEQGPVRVRYRYEPMLDIGGDFLFIHPIGKPRSGAGEPVSVVLIDVTGHGFPAALAVNRLYVELTRAFLSSDDPSPAHVISELNRAMASGLMPEAIYATALAIRLRTQNGEHVLEWCGAGHPDGLLQRAGGELIRLPSGAPMLGVLDDGVFSCESSRIEAVQGDRVFTFTDGVLEARSPDGEMFGFERIEASLAGGTGAEGLFEAVEQFRKGPTADDVLIVEVGIGD